MTTLLDRIRSGAVPATVAAAADAEHIAPQALAEAIARGTAVLPRNAASRRRPVAVGAGTSTKVNANLGTSPDSADLTAELRKLEAAVRAGADAVMDLSTGGDIDATRREILARSPVPVGTVPVYQAFAQAVCSGRDIATVTADDLFRAVERHAADGVDFATIHCGVTRATIAALRARPRICGIVSRGGALMAEWIVRTGRENPFFERFDELIELARTHDLTLSLGDGLRPGALADANDDGQLAELQVLADLAVRAHTAGVQVILEGPGHMRLDLIADHVRHQKRITGGKPYYLLGPLVTDIAAGYDHITCAIGGAIAASAGADFICYVTPAEHLRLPDAEDVYAGVMASRIAAHAADIVKGVPGAWERDRAMSEARKALDWDRQAALALDPDRVRSERARVALRDPKVCAMCGPFCAMKESSKVGL